MTTDHLRNLIDIAAQQLDQSATLQGLANARAIAKARAELETLEAPETEDRRTVYSFEVNGTHVRWCGSLEQYHRDRLAYVDSSLGRWETVSARCHKFHDSQTGTDIFRAVKN